MELDPDTVDGHWSTNSKTGMDFFIINDAIFSKLCILGEDVEPCFEGASITAPTTSFTKMDDNFKKTLYNMMQDLKFALEGGQTTMEETVIEETVDTAEVAAENAEPVAEEETVATEVEESSTENDNSEQSNSTETQETVEEVETSDVQEEEPVAVEETNTEFTELQEKYTALEKQYQELVNFKNSVENKEKDNLIARFYMLSDEDKADVIAHKEEYSLDEIESKLSVICFRKKVNFNLNSEEEEGNSTKEDNVTTYTLQEETLPAFVSALKDTRDSRNE